MQASVKVNLNGLIERNGVNKGGELEFCDDEKQVNLVWVLV